MKPTVELFFLLAMAGAVTLALVITGCGGGGSQLTKAQFIQQGNAICKQAAVEQAKLASQHKGEVVSGNFEAVTEVFVPPMEKELRRLQALSPPQADEQEIGTILRAIESGVEDAKADYLDLFVKETDPFVQANALARKYGLEACAESSHAVIKPQG
jgi:hypothetical protein